MEPRYSASFKYDIPQHMLSFLSDKKITDCVNDVSKELYDRLTKGLASEHIDTHGGSCDNGKIDESFDVKGKMMLLKAKVRADSNTHALRLKVKAISDEPILGTPEVRAAIENIFATMESSFESATKTMLEKLAEEISDTPIP